MVDGRATDRLEPTEESFGIAHASACAEGSRALGDGRAMSLYTLKHLLDDCSARRTRTKGAADEKRETLADVWRALNDWISSRFDIGKGVHIATFATISYEASTTSRNERKLRPILLLADSFVRTYGLTHKWSLLNSNSRAMAPLEELNCTKIAIKFSQQLTKDVVSSGVRDLLQRIGEAAGAGAMLSIAFNVGRLVAKDRCVAMVFEPLEIPRQLEDEVARSLMVSSDDDAAADVDSPRLDATKCDVALLTSQSNVETVAGDTMASPSLADELEALALLPRSPGLRHESAVMDAAFRRHVSHLADDVDREAAYARDTHRQQQRDVAAIALEATMRRARADALQRYVRNQIDEQRSARLSDRHAQKHIDASASSFYCDSEWTRLGFDDPKYIERNKQDLKTHLLSQMTAREAERASDKQQQLRDDALALRRLRCEMDSVEQQQRHDRDAQRKTLTDAWHRDTTVKQLVEAKMKQQQRLSVEPTMCGSGRTPRCHTAREPLVLRQQQRVLTPRYSSNTSAGARTSESDFSVGFDIRSVCE